MTAATDPQERLRWMQSKGVVLSGDRQLGKTHTLLTVAGAAAFDGQRVAYTSVDLRFSRALMEEFIERFQPLIVTPRWTNGDYRVVTVNGGMVLFRSYRQTAVRADTYILDDFNPDDLPRIGPEVLGAKHLYFGLMADDR